MVTLSTYLEFHRHHLDLGSCVTRIRGTHFSRSNLPTRDFDQNTHLVGGNTIKCNIVSGKIFSFRCILAACCDRYKCVVCPGYDMCGVCESRAMHPAHDMVRLAAPRQYPPHFFMRLHRFILLYSQSFTQFSVYCFVGSIY